MCAPPSQAVPSLLRVSNAEYQQMASDLLSADFAAENFKSWTPLAQVEGFDGLSAARFDSRALTEQLSTIETLAAQLVTEARLKTMCPATQPTPAPCAVKATYNAQSDFSAAQGQNCWSYSSSDGKALTYDAATMRYGDASQGLFVWANGQHPGNGDAVRKWTSPLRGNVVVTGSFKDTDPGGGDGIKVAVRLKGKDLWSRPIPNRSSETFEVRTFVRPGDTLELVVNRNAESSYDSTAVEAAIAVAATPVTAGWTWDNCGQAFVNRYASRMFRRPLRAEELAQYQTLFASFEQGAEQADLPSPFIEALRGVMEAALASPNVVMKPELIAEGFTADEKQFAVASKLSLFLRSSFPDEALWALAAQGQLSDDTAIEAQVRRLIDEDTSRLALNFGGQWLGFRRAALSAEKSPLDASYYGESGRVFESLFRDDAPAWRLLKPGFTYVDAPLAMQYKLTAPPTGTPWHKVDTDARGGFLNQGLFLAADADGSEFRRVIHRGLWVLTRVLCRSLPRLDAATRDEINASVGKIDRTLPLSEQMRFHRQASSRCPACHQEMDPLGLALEKYDAQGNRRETTPDGKPIVNDFAFNGVPVENPEQLIQMLVDSPEVSACMTDRLLTYAFNRKPSTEEMCLVSTLAAKDSQGRAPSMKEVAVRAFLQSLKQTGVSP
jgi:Protein of unknown function (DUF1592)/Protein of unknown function (DUF1588)/Protein of unknown function (DUF1595)/Protein of unknown function (DUF1585)